MLIPRPRGLVLSPSRSRVCFSVASAVRNFSRAFARSKLESLLIATTLQRCDLRSQWSGAGLYGPTLDGRGGEGMVIDLALRPVDAGFVVVRRVACSDRRLTSALINFDICAISFVRPAQTRPSEIPDGGKFAATCADSRKTLISRTAVGYACSRWSSRTARRLMFGV